MFPRIRERAPARVEGGQPLTIARNRHALLIDAKTLGASGHSGDLGRLAPLKKPSRQGGPVAEVIH